MTILEKIDRNATIARSNAVEPNEAIQRRQEIAASGKTMPVTKPAGVPSGERKKELDQAVKNVSGYVQNVTRELNFTVDEELDKFVVTVLDEKTGEVIRQIPTEEMLELAKSISDAQASASKGIFKGVLFQGSA